MGTKGDLSGRAKAKTTTSGMHHEGAETRPESMGSKLSDVGSGVMPKREAKATMGKNGMSAAVRHLDKMASAKHYKHKK